MVTKDLAVLTSLRFIAALAVFLSHIPFVEGTPYAFFHLERGFIGVTFFFILSGFILSHTYQNRRPFNLARFYLARFARIYPLYLLSLLVAVPLALMLGETNFILCLPSWFAIQAAIPIKSVYFALNGPSWSISTELFFYLAFPMLLKLKRWQLASLSSAIVIYQLCVVYSHLSYDLEHALIYISPLARSFDFMLGILLYRCCYGRVWSKPSWVQSFALFSLLVFLVVPEWVYIQRAFLYDLYFCLPFCLLIYAFSLEGGMWGKLLAIKPLIQLGHASFAFYLFHKLIIAYLALLIEPRDIESSGGLLFSSFALSLICSLLLYRYVESPMRLNIIKRFSA